jgi:HEAT repeat protein
MSRLPLLGILVCLVVGGFLIYQIITKPATVQPQNESPEQADEHAFPRELGSTQENDDLPYPFLVEAERDADNKSDQLDLDFLKRMGAGTDAASLVEYLKKHSPEDVDPSHLEPWIQQLGDPSLEKREQAFNKLTNIGLVALESLRKAKIDDDPGIKHLVHKLVDNQEQDIHWGLNLAVIRRLVNLNPPGTVDILLRFLPFAASEELIEEIWYGIGSNSVKEGKVDVRLVQALEDNLPARRAVVACIVGRVGGPGQKQAVLKLLNDANDSVKLRAAQGLLAGGENTSVEALIGLLASPSISVTWQAEELLIWLAGEDSPQARVGPGTSETRRISQEAWKKWRSAHPLISDLLPSAKKHRRPSLFLICENGEHPEGGSDIWLGGCDGVPRWNMRTDRTTLRMQFLNGDKLATLELQNRHVPQLGKSLFSSYWAVRDLEGKIHREKLCDYFASSVEFLPNGNLVLFSRDSVYELSESGKEIRSTRLAIFELGNLVVQEVLGNGNLLVASKDQDIFEWNRNTLKTEREVQLPQRIDIKTVKAIGKSPSRGYVAILLDVGNIWQLDSNGRLLKPWPVHSANGASLLRNGNLLAALGDRSNQRLVEIEPSGKKVWEAVRHYSGALRYQTVLNLVRFGFERSADTRPDIDSAPVRAQRLQSKDPTIRAFSAAMLGRTDAEDAKPLEKLVVLLGDEDDNVRREASDALLFKADKVRDSLIKAAKSPNTKMRAGAIQLLGYSSQHTSSLVPILTEALNDESRLVRFEGAISLANLGPVAERAIPRLIDCLNDRTSVPGEPLGLCGAALMALERIGTEREDAVTSLSLLLSDDDTRVRVLAARGLSTVGKADIAVPALLKALKENSNPNVQRIAVWALGRRGPQAKEALATLLDLLDTLMAKPNSESSSLIVNIIETLGSLGSEGKPAVSRLTKLMIDGYGLDVRKHAAEALGKIGHATPDVLEALRIASQSTEDLVRQAAQSSLAKISSKTGIHGP